MLTTSYHEIGFEHDARHKAAERVMKGLTEYDRSVGLVFTGLSGILVGLPVADLTQRQFAVVRKPNDSSHACYLVEGYSFSEYVIVDDFMSSGDTIKRIIDTMRERDGSVCKGILFYDNHRAGKGDTFKYKEQVIPIIPCVIE